MFVVQMLIGLDGVWHLPLTLKSQSSSCVPKAVEETERVFLTLRLTPLRRAESAIWIKGVNC